MPMMHSSAPRSMKGVGTPTAAHSSHARLAHSWSFPTMPRQSCSTLSSRVSSCAFSGLSSKVSVLEICGLGTATVCGPEETVVAAAAAAWSDDPNSFNVPARARINVLLADVYAPPTRGLILYLSLTQMMYASKHAPRTRSVVPTLTARR